jgi:type I restriction enzyme S subunit
VVPARSVLVTCIGATIGKASISEVQCAVNQQINAIIPDTSLVLPEWLIAAVSALSFQAVIRANASSTTMPILNKSKFQNLRIRVPSLETQAVLIGKYHELTANLNHGRSATSRVRSLSSAMRKTVLTAAFGSAN